MDDRTLDRFMRWVEIQPNGCWRWKGKLSEQGYGYFWLDAKSRLAHRVSYEHFVGGIPDGYEVDHLCHTRDQSCAGGRQDPHRACVAPHDLQAVTGLENVMRSRGIAAENAAKRQCKHGHELNAGNTYVYPNGERCCRICQAHARRTWSEQHRPATRLRPEHRTHCPSGHAYNDKNTFIDARGSRVCIACRRQKDREAKRLKRAANRIAS